jgi:hypothetical protein
MPVFVAATAVGMAPWVTFYALVGSSGRALFAAGLATPGRGLHSSTSRLNVSAFYGIGVAFRGCLGGV